ncbi:MAG: SRPBCC family protein [Anditalea sp.]
MKNQDNYQNVNEVERVLSVASGIILWGVSFKRPFRNPLKYLSSIYLLYRGISGNCPVYTKLGKDSTKTPAINLRAEYVVDVPRQEVYDFWRKLENLPLFMRHLKSVDQLSDNRSRWEARLPGNSGTLSWEADIVKDIPGKLIGWKSTEGAIIDNAGKVEFYDDVNSSGTLIRVIFSYHPVVGGLGTGIAKFLNPAFEKLLNEELHDFKILIEGGELENKNISHPEAKMPPSEVEKKNDITGGFNS